jgi:hypothetical protein
LSFMLLLFINSWSMKVTLALVTSPFQPGTLKWFLTISLWIQFTQMVSWWH